MKDVKRNISYDVIAGILIIRMILGHYVSYAGLKDSVLFDSLNLLYFYMPWFFYKSGMFAKPVADLMSKKKYAIKEFKRLIIPFVVFTIVGLVCSLSYDLITTPSVAGYNLIRQIGSFIQLGYIYWSSHLWFLLALFVIKCLYNMYLYKCNQIALLGISLCFAYLHNRFVAPSGCIWGGYIFSGIIFFVLGKMMKDIQYEKVCVVFSFTLIGIIAIFCPTFVSMFGNTLQNNGQYLLWYPFCFGGIVLINNVFRTVSEKSMLFTMLSLIGKNSMSYYLTHFSIAVLACKLYHSYNIESNNWAFLCVLLIVSSFVLPILSDILNKNNVKWIIGK